MTDLRKIVFFIFMSCILFLTGCSLHGSSDYSLASDDILASFPYLSVETVAGADFIDVKISLAQANSPKKFNKITVNSKQNEGYENSQFSDVDGDDFSEIYSFTSLKEETSYKITIILENTVNSDKLEAVKEVITKKQGSGKTLTDPYIIYSVKDLTAAGELNRADSAVKYFELGNNIDASGLTSCWNEFTGNLDGKNYRIKGLPVTFCGTLKDGSIKNILFDKCAAPILDKIEYTVKNVDIPAVASITVNVSSFVEKPEKIGFVTSITNCYIADIRLNIADLTISGQTCALIVGQIENGILKNAETSGSLNFIGESVGSSIPTVSGICTSILKGKVIDCTNGCSITTQGIDGALCGICFYNFQSSLQRCVNNGKLKCLNGSAIGGICSLNTAFNLDEFSNCINNGVLEGGKQSTISGICISNFGKIYSCNNNGRLAVGEGGGLFGISMDKSGFINCTNTQKIGTLGTNTNYPVPDFEP